MAAALPPTPPKIIIPGPPADDGVPHVSFALTWDPEALQQEEKGAFKGLDRAIIIQHIQDYKDDIAGGVGVNNDGAGYLKIQHLFDYLKLHFYPHWEKHRDISSNTKIYCNGLPTPNSKKNLDGIVEKINCVMPSFPGMIINEKYALHLTLDIKNISEKMANDLECIMNGMTENDVFNSSSEFPHSKQKGMMRPKAERRVKASKSKTSRRLEKTLSKRDLTKMNTVENSAWFSRLDKLLYDLEGTNKDWKPKSEKWDRGDIDSIRNGIHKLIITDFEIKGIKSLRKHMVFQLRR